MINLRDLEFDILSLDCENENEIDGIQYDDYNVYRLDNGNIEIEFGDHNDYMNACNSLYYIYNIVECIDDGYKLIVESKNEFTKFIDKNLIKVNKIYRHLYGITITPNLKRMIMFLCNIDLNTANTYISSCTDPIKESVSIYFKLLYNM